MAIKDILERIERETETAVSEILDRAGAEADRVRSDYTARADGLRRELEERGRKKALEEQRRLIVNEQLELRKTVLAKKREILDEVYEEAKRMVESLSGGELLEQVKLLILKKSVTGRETIVVAQGRESLFPDSFIGELNAAYPGGGGFTLGGEPGDFSWGVVLREGRMVVDLTLDVIFEQLKEAVEPRVAKVLFPEEE